MKQVVRVGLLTVAGLVLASCGVVTEDVEAKPEELTQSTEVESLNEVTQSIESVTDDGVENIEYVPFDPTKYTFDMDFYYDNYEHMEDAVALKLALEDDYLQTDMDIEADITDYQGVPIGEHLYKLNRESLKDSMEQLFDTLSRTGGLTSDDKHTLMMGVDNLYRYNIMGAFNLLNKKLEHIGWSKELAKHINNEYDLNVEKLEDTWAINQEGLNDDINRYLETLDVYKEYKGKHDMPTWGYKYSNKTVAEKRKKYRDYWKDNESKGFINTIKGEDLNIIHGIFNRIRLERVYLENGSGDSVDIDEDKEIVSTILRDADKLVSQEELFDGNFEYEVRTDSTK